MIFFLERLAVLALAEAGRAVVEGEVDDRVIVKVVLLVLEDAKSLQSCLTLCDHIDDSPPGFPVPGILQARTLEWVAISFSNA